MKNFKFLMPVMAFVMAVGLAFANKANVQSNGWVERNNVPYQLEDDPCILDTDKPCRVVFDDDPGNIHQVYTTSNLVTPKLGGNGSYFILSE